jgi:hypothetical protein
VIIKPSIPKKRDTISNPIWPPGDQPNITARSTPINARNSAIALA